MQTLQSRCPLLFQSPTATIPQDEAESDEKDLSEEARYIGDATHINPLVLGKLSSGTVVKLKLPTTMRNIEVDNPFFAALHQAMMIYGHETYALGSKPLYWHNQCSFKDP